MAEEELAAAFSRYIEGIGFVLINTHGLSLEKGKRIWANRPNYPYHQQVYATIDGLMIYLCDGMVRLDVHCPDSFETAGSIMRLCHMADRDCAKCVFPVILRFRTYPGMSGEYSPGLETAHEV